MKGLVVVSNRVSLPGDKKGRAGGLAVAISEMLRGRQGLWFGWSGRTVPDRGGKVTLARENGITYATLDLARTDHAEYYNGFANRALWPLLHLRLDLAQFDKQEYSSYLRVNRLFAEKLLGLIPPNDPIWIHDYHLIPLAAELRPTIGDRPIGFFLHTPLPPLEVLAALPAHRALMRAMCAHDVIGFQTANDLRAFHDYIVHEANGQVLGNGLIRAFDRTFRAEAFPIGIDTGEMIGLAAAAEREGRVRRLRERARGRTWIIGVDRLDYSKGIPQRFNAFATFLEARPDLKGTVTLMQIAPPSRAEVPEYMQIRRELEAAAGHVNGRFGEHDWMPIYYLNRSYTRAELAAFYRASRVGLVTPLRDGMNFVAKEYVAAQDESDPGMLVLSRFAGAARELDSALIVNPFDIAGTADAIGRALAMGREERQSRWRAMMVPLKANDLAAWCRRFLAALADAPYGI